MRNLRTIKLLGIKMNIDELVKSIPDAKLRDELAQWVQQWKKDDQDVEWLSRMLSKWHGNVWFNNDKASIDFLNHLNLFKRTAIEGLGGLSLNERLYFFGLFEHWEKANEIEQNKLRQKLHANA
jgi:hypothetical protein